MAFDRCNSIKANSVPLYDRTSSVSTFKWRCYGVSSLTDNHRFYKEGNNFKTDTQLHNIIANLSSFGNALTIYKDSL